jgi:hypothetical protein
VVERSDNPLLFIARQMNTGSQQKLLGSLFFALSFNHLAFSTSGHDDVNESEVRGGR